MLKLDWAGLAEAAVLDMRGNITLVGFNPQVIVADHYPQQLAPTLVIIVEDDETPEPALVAGRTLRIKLQVTDPDHSVLFFTEQADKVSKKSVRYLLGRVQILAQVPFIASKDGLYMLSANISIEEAPEVAISTSRRFVVTEKSSLPT